MSNRYSDLVIMDKICSTDHIDSFENLISSTCHKCSLTTTTFSKKVKIKVFLSQIIIYCDTLLKIVKNC